MNQNKLSQVFNQISPSCNHQLNIILKIIKVKIIMNNQQMKICEIITI